MDIDENTRFITMDFDTDRYIGMSVVNRKDAAPVLIMMSRDSPPLHGHGWSIQADVLSQVRRSSGLLQAYGLCSINQVTEGR